jgi:hypothetical protein
MHDGRLISRRRRTKYITIMKKFLPIALGILCLAVVTTDAQEKKKRERKPLTEEQKKVTKELKEKYDTNKDGKLDAEERKKMTAEDKEKFQKAMGITRKKKAAK